VLRGTGEQLFSEGATGVFGKVETRAFASGMVVLVLSEPRH